MIGKLGGGGGGIGGMGGGMGGGLGGNQQQNPMQQRYLAERMAAQAAAESEGGFEDEYPQLAARYGAQRMGGVSASSPPTDMTSRQPASRFGGFRSLNR